MGTTLCIFNDRVCYYLPVLNIPNLYSLPLPNKYHRTIEITCENLSILTKIRLIVQTCFARNFEKITLLFVFLQKVNNYYFTFAGHKLKPTTAEWHCYYILSSIMRHYRKQTWKQRRKADKATIIYPSTTNDRQSQPISSLYNSRIVADSRLALGIGALYSIHNKDSDTC
jgi:hypothetical protein